MGFFLFFFFGISNIAYFCYKCLFFKSIFFNSRPLQGQAGPSERKASQANHCKRSQPSKGQPINQAFRGRDQGTGPGTGDCDQGPWTSDQRPGTGTRDQDVTPDRQQKPISHPQHHHPCSLIDPNPEHPGIKSPATSKPPKRQ